ncbi:MAG TPA: molybdenum cofactor guanylyltransferase [Planctomycetota bacterium]|nr:molybdenum cofactor guanylyltransferase [Planctomycetota bacterium]
MRTGAIILAGGLSTRMGRPKELLPFGDSTLLGHTIDTLRTCATPIVVVTRDAAQALPALPAGVSHTHDEPAGAGPFAGLATGLRWLHEHGGLAAADCAFATACDQPFLTAGAVRWLLDQLGGHDLVMPRVGGFLQPFCAIYRLSVGPVADRLLAAGTSTPRSLATATDARILDEPELRGFDADLRFLQNLNTPADYDRARRER